ncbi:metal-dependent hydrolase [Candidatus Pantoea edessiphila]|uniref:Metal-dependent hydrolase n=1 Tax=Candidatus Pantoea edessiphila TaxID=2044610 RepID=A0A2P5T0L8_9GAMM|nr:metal-dependent hydrolase [Candidatus Pantoea edessiphila]PPI88127.1 metal-dependent hydrolase [Candidatus Pantoea edessiphila]
MTTHGHIIFAIASAIFAKRFEITSVMTQADWWHIIPAALTTCLIPDIDHPNSLIGQRFSWISQIISLIFGHRGFTHSLLALVILWLFNMIIFKKYIILPDDILQGMLIGYCSHIVADIMTPAGVVLLWPYRKRFRLPMINSRKNKKLEKKICISLVGFLILFPIYLPLIKYISLLIIKII